MDKNQITNLNYLEILNNTLNKEKVLKYHIKQY